MKTKVQRIPGPCCESKSREYLDLAEDQRPEEYLDLAELKSREYLDLAEDQSPKNTWTLLCADKARVGPRSGEGGGGGGGIEVYEFCRRTRY